ncbi:hypothetical protein WICPIJ_004413 [Wickerhamomyces pijperi]|uniref:E3 ubiquitin-protein ligase n=1 Tax=Wickerhamomyces pijperi TaxID=599730 RepID=A0A9P8Q852_WICPI|nr:hypothetical protein WICPIJ_004413 [Wickerhamomyces pijperi]
MSSLRGDPNLIRALQLLATKVTRTNNKVIADHLFQVLYFAITKDGKYLSDLFPDHDPYKFPSSLEDCIELENSFFRSKKEVHCHTGRNCGRKFKKGEPIYRCVECEFDNTCVLCVHCFNKDDHVGHQISTSICYDGNSGICDCGDPEAWTSELHCKAANTNTSANNGSSIEDTEGVSLPDDFKEVISQVYKCCLDFLITTFANQNQTNRTIQEKFLRYSRENLDAELLLDLKQEIEFNTEIVTSHSEKSPSDSRYVLTFWNDEYHNFQQAQEAIIHAAYVTGEQALTESNRIDKEGRSPLKVSDRLENLVGGLKSAFKDKFTATLTTERIFNTEEVTKYIIDWLLDSINHPNQEFQKISRRALCEAFCSECELPNIPYWSGETKIFHGYTGLLERNKLPGLKVNPTRLQFLTFFDLRFWKAMRTKLNELIVAVLVSDLEYKFIASDQMSRIYDLLLRNLWKIDREPFLTVMDHISIQFYTCPRDSTDIVQRKLHIIFPAVLEFFDSLSHTVNNKQKLVIPKRILDPTRAIKMTMRRIMQDLGYFFEKSTTMVPLFENKQVFQYFTEIIQRFDDFWTVSRKLGDHVTNENMDYLEHFETALHFFDILLAATKVDSLKTLDSSYIEESLIDLANSIHQSLTIKYKSFKDTMMIDYKVSSQDPSFIFLSNHLLTRILNLLIDSTASYKALTSKFDLLPLADRALRSVVLSKQIESNFWIRNGSVIFHQESIYRDLKSFSSRMSLLDINLIQIAMLTLNPADFFLNILDRFELLDWFQQSVDLDHTVYEDKITSMVQGVLSHLYVLLTERSNFAKYESEEKRSQHQLKTALIYTLYDGNKAFDAIEASLDSKLVEEKFFDEVLEEVAIFNPPKGLQDDGSFQLKEEYFNKIDPMNLHASHKDLQDVLPVLSKKLATASGKSPEEVIVEPRVTKLEHFKELGEFTRTSHFAKFIVKLLDHAIEKKEESYVPVVLHLLHAVLKDADLAYGKSYVVQTLYNVPLCEALFSVITFSDFSKETIVKADHLLELLILKNPNEVMDSLKSCFGEDSVGTFKQKKKTSGVDFDETEAERKRRLAKERQKKILDKMKKSSKTFIENYDQLHKEEAESDLVSANDETENTDTTNECILCRCPEEANKMLCIPVKVSRSNVFRDLPHNNPDFVERAFHEWEHESMNSHSHEEYIGIPYPLSVRDFDASTNNFGHSINFESNQVVSSCNHGIHFLCLQKHMKDNQIGTYSFPCPLCKTVHDEYVVSLLKTGNLTLDDLSPDELFVVPQYPGANDEDAMFPVEGHTADVMGGYLLFKTTKMFGFRGTQEMDSLIHENFGEHYTDQIKFYKKIRHWTMIIGNTISQTEISSRINGNSAYLNVLDQIPHQTMKMFRNIVPYYLLVQCERSSPSTMYLKDINRLLVKGSFINAFCMLYFFSADGFLETAETLIKTFVERYLRTFLKGTDQLGEYNVDSKDVIQSDNLEMYREIFNKTDANSPKTSPEVFDRFKHDDEFASKIVTMIEKIMVVNLRQLSIFAKIFVPDLEIKPEGTSDQAGTSLSIIETLLSSMNLPSYNEIVPSALSVLYLYASAKDITFDSTVPYPGVVKLVDLPQELNYFLTNAASNDGEEEGVRFPTTTKSLQQTNIRNRVDFSICLVCGHKIFKKTGQRELTQHIKEYSCSSENNGIFLTPSNNTISLITIMKGRAYIQKMNAPYLNTRGQSGPKAIKKGQIAKLNLTRYKHLNELWLGNGVTPLISRSIKHDRVMDNLLNMQGLDNAMDGDNEDDEDEDEDDEGGVFGFGPRIEAANANLNINIDQNGRIAVDNIPELQAFRRLVEGFGTEPGPGFPVLGGGTANVGDRLLEMLRAAGLQMGPMGPGGVNNDQGEHFSEDENEDFSDEYDNELDYDEAMERGRPTDGAHEEHDDELGRDARAFFAQLDNRLNALEDDDEEDEDFQYHDAEDFEEDDFPSEEEHRLDDYDSDSGDEHHPQHNAEELPIHHINESDWDSIDDDEETDGTGSENESDDDVVQENGEEDDDIHYGQNPTHRNLLQYLAQRNPNNYQFDPRNPAEFFERIQQERMAEERENEGYDDEESNDGDWVDDSDVSID